MILNRKHVFIFLFSFLIGFDTFAQMQAAQKINWDFDTTVVFKKRLPALWGVLSQTGDWNRFSNGYIASIKTTGELPGQQREIRFADGSQRNDVIAQFQPAEKFIVVNVTLPANSAITDNNMAFAADVAGDESSSLHIMIRAEGEDKAKKAFLDHLHTEAVNYILGLRTLLKD